MRVRRIIEEAILLVLESSLLEVGANSIRKTSYRRAGIPKCASVLKNVLNDTKVSKMIPVYYFRLRPILDKIKYI